MFEITAFTVEFIKDPFGIIPGKRYEFLMDIEVSEEDELFQDNGLALRVIFKVDEDRTSIVKYEFQERGTGKYLDYELEPEEAAFVEAFCKEHYGDEDADPS